MCHSGVLLRGMKANIFNKLNNIQSNNNDFARTPWHFLFSTIPLGDTVVLAELVVLEKLLQSRQQTNLLCFMVRQIN